MALAVKAARKRSRASTSSDTRTATIVTSVEWKKSSMAYSACSPQLLPLLIDMMIMMITMMIIDHCQNDHKILSFHYHGHETKLGRSKYCMSPAVTAEKVLEMRILYYRNSLVLCFYCFVSTDACCSALAFFDFVFVFLFLFLLLGLMSWTFSVADVSLI